MSTSEPPDQENPLPIRRFLTESFVIAAMPLAGYSVALAYEAGFLRRYAIPSWVIRLDLTHVLLATGAILVTVAAFYNWLRAIPAKPWLTLLYLAIIPFGVALIPVFLAIHTEWVSGPHLKSAILWISLSTAFALFLSYLFLIEPLVKHRSCGDWWDRWRLGAQEFQFPPPWSLARALETKGHAVLGMPLLATVFFLFALFPLVSWYGYRQASAQATFLVSASFPTCLAIRRYATTIICVNVDTAARLVAPSFRTIPEDASETFTLVALGRLRTPADTARRYVFKRPNTAVSVP